MNRSGHGIVERTGVFIGLFLSFMSRDAEPHLALGPTTLAMSEGRCAFSTGTCDGVGGRCTIHPGDVSTGVAPRTPESLHSGPNGRARSESVLSEGSLHPTAEGVGITATTSVGAPHGMSLHEPPPPTSPGRRWLMK